jgi:hypothetical protein
MSACTTRLFTASWLDAHTPVRKPFTPLTVRMCAAFGGVAGRSLPTFVGLIHDRIIRQFGLFANICGAFDAPGPCPRSTDPTALCVSHGVPAWRRAAFQLDLTQRVARNVHNAVSTAHF